MTTGEDEYRYNAMFEHNVVKINGFKEIRAVVVLIECAIAYKHVIGENFAFFTGFFCKNILSC
jgi:hypothetical protein